MKKKAAGRLARRKGGAGWRSLPWLALLLGWWAAGVVIAQQPHPVSREGGVPDVRYEPTPVDVIQAMLSLAQLKAGDILYDLGCGDGRIVIAAVRQRGVSGVCVDIDPQRIAESRENARLAGVSGRIRFVNDDLLTTNIGDATVVMLFLSEQLNLAVRPKLLRELKPGARVVSHWHDMGGWKPQNTVQVRSQGIRRPVYLWTIPPH